MIDEAYVAKCAAFCMQAELDRYRLAKERLGEKKARGAALRARFCLPEEMIADPEHWIERFSEDEPGYEWWCMYACLMKELHDELPEWVFDPKQSH